MFLFMVIYIIERCLKQELPLWNHKLTCVIPQDATNNGMSDHLPLLEPENKRPGLSSE